MQHPDVEGPVDVNSDITPTTRQPIPTVDQSTWNDASVSELYDQLITLQQRYYMMLDMGKGLIADQIQRGILQLEAQISEKQLDAQKRGLYSVR